MNYWNAIQNERQWSWSFVMFALIAGGLFIRHFVLRQLLRKVKRLPRDFRRPVQSAYLRRSMPGWGFFISAVLIGTWVWLHPAFLSPIMSAEKWQIVVGVLFCVSYFIHLQIYSLSIMNVVNEKLESGRSGSQVK